ncbi:hypothetical protein B0J17DRAFT_710765 [Rhizoctonia solani]|nr:hypothetical protein B0J17DRAFT_710765 [Rhizoctonia solani]
MAAERHLDIDPLVKPGLRASSSSYPTVITDTTPILDLVYPTVERETYSPPTSTAMHPAKLRTNSAQQRAPEPGPSSQPTSQSPAPLRAKLLEYFSELPSGEPSSSNSLGRPLTEILLPEQSLDDPRIQNQPRERNNSSLLKASNRVTYVTSKYDTGHRNSWDKAQGSSFGHNAFITEMASSEDCLAAVTNGGGALVWEIPKLTGKQRFILQILPGSPGLKKVKWHSSRTIAFASNNQVYLLDLREVEATFCGLPVYLDKLKQVAKVFEVLSFCPVAERFAFLLSMVTILSGKLLSAATESLLHWIFTTGECSSGGNKEQYFSFLLLYPLMLSPPFNLPTA